MFLDVLISFLLVGGGFRGFRKGAILQFISLVVLLLSIYILSVILGWFSRMHFFAAFVGFIVMLIFSFGVHLFTRYLEKFFEQQNYTQVFFIFGGVFGMFRYAFIMSVMLCILSQYNYKPVLLDYNNFATTDTTKSERTFFERSSDASYLYNIVNGMAPFLFQDLILENKRSIDEIKRSSMDVGIIPLPINKALQQMAKDSGRVEWRVLEKEHYKDSLVCMLEARVVKYVEQQKNVARFRFQLTKYKKTKRSTRAELHEYLINGETKPIGDGVRSLIHKQLKL